MVKIKWGGTVIFGELLVALTVTVLLSALLMSTFLKGEQRTRLIWIFLIIFLTTWAGGIWVRPFGPSFRGIYWLPFLWIGIITVLILVVFYPRRIPKSRWETLEMLQQIEKQKKLNQLTYITLTLLFWLLLLLLSLAIIVRYFKI
ncbi:MAG: hypothetical protein PVJ06_04455 [Desulfobacterales bacterium]|jgi:hypothetical protein